MTRRRPIRSEVWEREPIYTRFLLVRDSDGEAAKVSDVTSWSAFVYDLADFGQVFALEDQPVSDVISNVLRADGWDGQNPSYNGLLVVEYPDIPALGDHAYQIEINLETTEGLVRLVHISENQGMYST